MQVVDQQYIHGVVWFTRLERARNLGKGALDYARAKIYATPTYYPVRWKFK